MKLWIGSKGEIIWNFEGILNIWHCKPSEDLFKTFFLICLHSFHIYLLYVYSSCKVCLHRCNGRTSCSLSKDDAREKIPSNCPRMGPTPQLKIRYSLRSSGELVCKHRELSPPNDEPPICYTTIKVESEDVPDKLTDRCLDNNADWLHVAQDFDFECQNENIFYGLDYNFWSSPQFETSQYCNCHTALARCQTFNSSSTSALCAMPFVSRSSNNIVKCPSEEPFSDTYPGYSFPERTPGNVSYTCPEEAEGFATWECGAEGNWIGSANLE